MIESSGRQKPQQQRVTRAGEDSVRAMDQRYGFRYRPEKQSLPRGKLQQQSLYIY